MEKIEKTHYFDGPVSKGFVALYTGKTITIIASSLVGIFVPIFLYTLFGNRFEYVILFFGLSSFFYVFTVAFGAQFLNRIGFRNALRISVFLGASIFVVYYFLEINTAIYLVPLLLLLSVIYRLFYWLPYSVDFAKFTDPKNRARQLSAVRMTRMVATVIIPMFSGFIISKFGFDVLFIFATILYLISGIPYITIPRTKEHYSWGYVETWKKFFQNIRHKVIIAYIADGAESAIGLFIWPIFIFELLEGNYFEVGALSTLTVGVAVALQFVVGKYIDTHVQKNRMLEWGSILYSIGWIVKIFITTAFEIFVAGAYQTITKIFTRTPFDTMTYEMSADEGHYVDEFTVLKEMALHTGRFIMAVFIILASFSFEIQWVFVFGAFAALFMTLIRSRDVHLSTHVLR